MKASPSIIWITPQTLDELRREAEFKPVKVRELPPIERTAEESSDDNADLQNILLNAPRIVMRGLKSGWCKIIPQPPLPTTNPVKGVWKRRATVQARANHSAAMKRSWQRRKQSPN